MPPVLKSIFIFQTLTPNYYIKKIIYIKKSLLCCPVSVPHNVGGSRPVGVVTAKESVQTPAVVSVMSKNVKSSLK